ncbi:class I SAM-dependent methyltransferase [Desulfobaculum sp. SPO524]|uniref:class I SAM-dependent methyltransferase n=1 Tax=Desulfobaculum sp. SPO524 TaxID=3378071 RepID=UPI0038531148
MQDTLTGIPETMLIPLWARAVETGKPHPIIRDEKAVEMVSRIAYDFSVFEKSWMSQVGVSVRTMLLDNATRDFIARHPGAVIVNIGAGLDTRVERMKNENITFWYDLDVQESIGMRRQFFTEGKRNGFLAASAFDHDWMDRIDAHDKPVLFICEGLFMYIDERHLRPLFRRLAQRFPGSEMLFDMLPPFLVGKGKHHDAINKLGTLSDFKWGLKRSRDIESWSPELTFIEEWDYYDYFKDRWRWWGYIGRCPGLRPYLSNRIVHFGFAA